MKKRITVILIVFLIVSMILYKYTYTKGTDYIVFPKDSTALIIDNWFEIREIKALYNLNYHFYDCCSSTGENLYFIQKPNKYFTINRESDHLYLYNNSLIDSSWSRLQKRFNGNSVYYIYSLMIPSQTNKDSIIRLMINDKFRVIEPFDYYKEQPYLRIRIFKQNIILQSADKLISNIDDSLKILFEGINFIDFKMHTEGQGFGINKNDFIFEYTITFNDNESLAKAKERLKNSNFMLMDSRVYDFKTIWLFSKEKNISKIRESILTKYKMIKNIDYK
jgi:hypothetical protein